MIKDNETSATEWMDKETSEGTYLFVPQYDDQLPKQFSQLVKDVQYQKGDLIEQTTIIYSNNQTQENALIKVRFSPLEKEIIEFEVELAPIPVLDDFQGKDVTVNWKFYNGMDPQGTFWTDSNGLEMQKREI